MFSFLLSQASTHVHNHDGVSPIAFSMGGGVQKVSEFRQLEATGNETPSVLMLPSSIFI